MIKLRSKQQPSQKTLRKNLDTVQECRDIASALLKSALDAADIQQADNSVVAVHLEDQHG